MILPQEEKFEIAHNLEDKSKHKHQTSLLQYSPNKSATMKLNLALISLLVSSVTALQSGDDSNSMVCRLFCNICIILAQEFV